MSQFTQEDWDVYNIRISLSGFRGLLCRVYLSSVLLLFRVQVFLQHYLVVVPCQVIEREG